MTSRDVELINSSINNGRIYFPSTDIKFFPSDSFSDRQRTGHKGKSVTFLAGGIIFESDIRVCSGQRISPRRDFRRFFVAVLAKTGAKVRVTRTTDREYELEYLG